MSVSSSIDIHIYSYEKPDNPFDIYLSFLKNGWTHPCNGIVYHIPLGDKGGFAWQESAFSTDEVKELINKKLTSHEFIGFGFVKCEGPSKEDVRHITMLRHRNETYSIMLHVYRKQTFDGITDVNWYLSEIYKIVRHAGYEIESVKFSEHV